MIFKYTACQSMAGKGRTSASQCTREFLTAWVIDDSKSVLACTSLTCFRHEAAIKGLREYRLKAQPISIA